MSTVRSYLGDAADKGHAFDLSWFGLDAVAERVLRAAVTAAVAAERLEEAAAAQLEAAPAAASAASPAVAAAPAVAPAALAWPSVRTLRERIMAGGADPVDWGQLKAVLTLLQREGETQGPGVEATASALAPAPRTGVTTAPAPETAPEPEPEPEPEPGPEPEPKPESARSLKSTPAPAPPRSSKPLVKQLPLSLQPFSHTAYPSPAAVSLPPPLPSPSSPPPPPPNVPPVGYLSKASLSVTKTASPPPPQPLSAPMPAARPGQFTAEQRARFDASRQAALARRAGKASCWRHTNASAATKPAPQPEA